MKDKTFENKIVLITAGSKGIGFAIAKEFLKCGAKVTISSRNISNLKNAKKALIKIAAKDKILNINFKSAIYSSTIALNKMKKKGWGRIINLTSSTAKEPAKKMCLSNVSRAALASFAKTLSLEVGEFGVTVNTILTGGVLTDRLKNLIKIRIKKSNLKLNQEINKISKNIPVGRIASPDEFIQLIIFLASEKSSYVNGAAIPIDGGTSKSLF